MEVAPLSRGCTTVQRSHSPHPLASRQEGKRFLAAFCCCCLGNSWLQETEATRPLALSQGNAQFISANTQAKWPKQRPREAMPLPSLMTSQHCDVMMQRAWGAMKPQYTSGSPLYMRLKTCTAIPLCAKRCLDSLLLEQWLEGQA